MSGARPIVLVGLMLSGKTTVGARLAERMGCPFVDLDEAIVERAGRSIADIFAVQGEPAFRRLESELLADLLSRPGRRVVATGGGAVIQASNRALMKRRSFVVYLEGDPRVLAARQSGSSGRPLLDSAEDAERTLGNLLAMRRDFYLEVQHCRLPADTLDVSELTEAIVRAYEAYPHS